MLMYDIEYSCIIDISFVRFSLRDINGINMNWKYLQMMTIDKWISRPYTNVKSSVALISTGIMFGLKEKLGTTWTDMRILVKVTLERRDSNV